MQSARSITAITWKRARFTQRQLAVYFGNCVAMQDGAEAMNCLKRLSDRMQCLCGTTDVDYRTAVQRHSVPPQRGGIKKGKAVMGGYSLGVY